MNSQLSWGHNGLTLEFEWSDDAPVQLAAVTLGGARVRLGHAVPAVEVLAAHTGHTPASSRLAHTAIGQQLRYVSHLQTRDSLVILLSAPGIGAELRLSIDEHATAVRSEITVRNDSDETLVLLAVPSWAAAIGSAPGSDPIGDWQLLSGRSDWLGEGRWASEALSDIFPRLDEQLTGHNPRGSHTAVSTGGWSTAAALPTAVVSSEKLGLAWAWQIEHNGAWRWELGQDTPGGYLALSGPTDVNSAWSKVLASGEAFTTVPVSVALGVTVEGAVAALTAHRRARRRQHDDNAAMPVVFNDYMNTLNGDPTTEKLLPLITAAAGVGAEIFCIDAGWYDNSGHWWDSVGAWLPSTTRFPGGLGEVIDHIRVSGMVPGLWLEPEVIGVQSPLAGELPAEAFLQRHGQRILEHNRYHLDLRHPAAVAHLDAVVDRLVAEFGIGFFKFDYNIDPGAGTDVTADSVGDGLLEVNRAHLRWLDRLLDRHPQLVIENCASGAMRMDFAMMSRLAMQSTSDQQEFSRFPAIAASAPLSLLPEQAANWAYPQPGMSAEQITFCLATGLLGRFYLSGYLNEMTDAERALVTEAVAVAQLVKAEITSGYPTWPLGLPGWDDAWIALGLRGDSAELVTVWYRNGDPATVLQFPEFVGRDLDISTVFPTSLDQWSTHWNADAGTLAVHATGSGPAARTFRLTPVRT